MALQGRQEVVESPTAWTPRSLTVSFRVWGGRLYRRVENPRYKSGYRVESAPLGREGAVRELLNT